jgi:hypothetical protein
MGYCRWVRGGLAICCLLGCGRIGFDPQPQDEDSQLPYLIWSDKTEAVFALDLQTGQETELALVDKVQGLVWANERIYATSESGEIIEIRAQGDFDILDRTSGCDLEQLDHDSTENALYIADDVGFIWRYSLVSGEILEIAEGLSEPSGLVVDDENQILYWTSESGDTLSRMSTNGENRETLYAGISAPQQIFLDDNRLFWAERRQLQRGTTSGAPSTSILETSEQARGIFVASEHNKLFWTELTSVNPPQSSVWWSNLDGTSPEALYEGSMVTMALLVLERAQAAALGL